VFVSEQRAAPPERLPANQARGFRIFDVVHTEEDLPETSPGPWSGAFP
jgi:hypothetical protein